MLLEKKLVWAVSECLAAAGGEQGLARHGEHQAVLAVLGLAGLAGGHKKTEQA